MCVRVFGSDQYGIQLLSDQSEHPVQSCYLPSESDYPTSRVIPCYGPRRRSVVQAEFHRCYIEEIQIPTLSLGLSVYVYQYSVKCMTSHMVTVGGELCKICWEDTGDTGKKLWCNANTC